MLRQVYPRSVVMLFACLQYDTTHAVILRSYTAVRTPSYHNFRYRRVPFPLTILLHQDDQPRAPSKYV